MRSVARGRFLLPVRGEGTRQRSVWAPYIGIPTHGMLTSAPRRRKRRKGMKEERRKRRSIGGGMAVDSVSSRRHERTVDGGQQRAAQAVDDMSKELCK
ncbi:hypothetical protein BHE74_00021004 [Ensete ventricosum]|nr:hypothetical protein BHE74_00021004 [Ensete ventricosum]